MKAGHGSESRNILFGGYTIENQHLDTDIPRSESGKNTVFDSRDAYEFAIAEVRALKGTRAPFKSHPDYSFILVKPKENLVLEVAKLSFRGDKKNPLAGKYRLDSRYIYMRSPEEQAAIEPRLWEEVTARPDTEEGNDFKYMLCVVDPVYGVVKRVPVYRQGRFHSDKAASPASLEVKPSDAEIQEALVRASEDIERLAGLFTEEGALNIKTRRGIRFGIKPKKAYRAKTGSRDALGQYTLPFDYHRNIEAQSTISGTDDEWKEATERALHDLSGVVSEFSRQGRSHAERGDGLDIFVSLQRAMRETVSNRLRIPVELKNGHDETKN